VVLLGHSVDDIITMVQAATNEEEYFMDQNDPEMLHDVDEWVISLGYVAAISHRISLSSHDHTWTVECLGIIDG
jgi:hypothetical protein